MGYTRNAYRATNINTGEIIEGSSAYIAKIIDSKTHLISQASEKGIKVKNEWIINTMGQIITKNNGINAETCRKWDDFTGPIREYIRRRDNGKERHRVEGRMQGMNYAYNIAKERGVEALYADIKKRNILKAPMKFTNKQMDEFYQYVSRNLYNNMLMTVLYTLHDKYQFGAKRLKEFKARFDKTVGDTMNLDYMGEHYVRLEDYAVELNEKYNLGIDVNLVAMSQDSYDETDYRYGRCKVSTVIEELRNNGFFDAAEFLDKKTL